MGTASRAAVAVLVLTAGSAAIARPRAPHAAAPVPGAPLPAPASPLDIWIAEGGSLTQVHVEGGKLHARSSAKGDRERSLSLAQHEQLTAAARKAAADPYPRSRCDGGGETWLSVTVDGRTWSAALCAAAPPRAHDEPWRTIVDLVRALLTSP